MIRRKFASIYKFKKHIKKKYNHNLIFSKIEALSSRDYFYHSYRFTCNKCDIKVIFSVYTFNKSLTNRRKIDVEYRQKNYYFVSKSKFHVVNYYKCNQYIIKKILE